MSDTDDIIEMPQPLALYARDLLNRAKQYLEAFKTLSVASNLPFPAYFCLAHSLELFLKSYLVLTGLTKKDLKSQSVRHSPEKLLEMCLENGLAPIPLLPELAVRLDDMNAAPTYDFRYPSGYVLHLPPTEEAVPIMETLSSAVAAKVENAALLAYLQFASDARKLRSKKIKWAD